MRAEWFLAGWIGANIPPVVDPAGRAGELDRLVAKLIADAAAAGIPGAELVRAAGGDLRRFVEVLVAARAS
jgi:hypothetical protein